jgi:hypothetical protein
VANHLIAALGCGRLDDGQVELVVAEPLEGLVLIDELNEESVGAVLAPRPAIQIAQQRRLVGTTQKDFRIAAIDVPGDGSQSNEGAQMIHGVIVSASEFRWAAVRGNTEPAL